jgi:AraC family transcriptional regulator, regulatory protein of adaptative response / methylated-DNA-[protein]-cysteine methyltransferase
MREAFLGGDGTFDGIFWTGVRSTGIFCKPSCSARKPRPDQLSFFATAEEAEAAGYRPCKRCRPLEASGSAPSWLDPLLSAVDADPSRRWSERDLRDRGFQPERVRRWFQRAHGMTFQEYHRARRLGAALQEVQGGRAVGRVAFESGYDSLSGFQEAFRQTFGAPPTELGDALLIRVDHLTTPLGPMLIGASELGIHLLEFSDRTALERRIRRTRDSLRAVLTPAPSDLGRAAQAALDRYFGGSADALTGLPLEPVGTPFQRDVWARLERIPAGETITYADVATSLGRPTAGRAVGAAVGANPLALLVPCHRVVGADGRPTGYAGGLWRKRRLLDLERAARTAGS